MMKLKYNERTGDFEEIFDDSSKNGIINDFQLVLAENEYKRIVVNGVEFKMIKVEGGSFIMGATPEMEPVTLDKPCHKVILSDFWIGETQVTQQLWTDVMGYNPSKYINKEYPVIGTSWNECQGFIQRMKEISGLDFRFPTEAEWEYAARGGRKTHGYKYSGSNNPSEVAWFSQEKENLHPVKRKKPNELGIYDMSGNGEEWCSDWVGNYDCSTQINPKGPLTGNRKIGRGGDWSSSAKFTQCSFRSTGCPPHIKYLYHGLRLAL